MDAQPYSSPREHLDDYLERVRLLVTRHIVRYWYRLTDRQGELKETVISMEEVRRSLKGLGTVHPPHERRGLPALEELEENKERLVKHRERAAVLARSGWVDEAHLPSHIQKETEARRMPEVTIQVGTSAADAERIGEAFANMRDATDDVEGRIEAYDLGLPKDLNHEFAGLEAEESIAQELDELKKRVSGESEPKSEVS